MTDRRCALILCTMAAIPGFALCGPAHAQGVAFQPSVGSLPVGPSLGVTPAVSLDRRYVRLGINVQFIDNAGFTTYNVPAAVGGGPGGPGALGGLGGVGGIAGGGMGGGGVGGNGNGGGGAVGGQFFAGMNGVITPNPMAGYSGYGYPPGGYGYGLGLPQAPAQTQPEPGSDLAELAAMNAAAQQQHQIQRATPRKPGAPKKAAGRTRTARTKTTSPAAAVSRTPAPSPQPPRDRP